MAAEKIGLAVVLVFSRSRVRLDIHAAGWINHIISYPKIPGREILKSILKLGSR